MQNLCYSDHTNFKQVFIWHYIMDLIAIIASTLSSFSSLCAFDKGNYFA